MPLFSIKNITQLKKENYPTLLAQVSKIIFSTNKNNKQTTQYITSNCDTIILKSGAKLLGTVTNINHKKVYFKNCDPSPYTSSTINKNDINTINFVNGNKGLNGFIKPDKPPFKSYIFNAILGFIFSLAAVILFLCFASGCLKNADTGILLFALGFICCTIGLTLSIISLIQKIKSNDENKVSAILAAVGFALGIIFFILILHFFKVF
jgi:hypothetical protein